MTTEDRLKNLQKATDRLIRFGYALLHMGAVETPKALEDELMNAFDVLQSTKD